MKSTLALLLLAALSGCSTTTYRATAKDPKSDLVITRELTAKTFLVNRELGAIKLGDDSLAGAKSDATSAIEALSAIALKAATAAAVPK